MTHVVMVKKVDSTTGFRFCIDARGVNKHTKFVPFHPPTIESVLRAIMNKPFKARFDMISSYWQIVVAE